MADYRTPGVYIVEKNAFPNQDGTVVAVATAIPIFIGYTEKAERNGKSLKGIPTKLSSLAEYTALFGGSYQHLFEIKPANTGDTFTIGAVAYEVVATKRFRLYDSMRLFYANGGGDCYILSVGDYSGAVVATELMNDRVQTALEKEPEPTLIVISDALEVAATNGSACYQIYKAVLSHCQKMQSRFGIFDVPPIGVDDDANAAAFRNGIFSDSLNYGAAYYPMLNTTIVAGTAISFRNLAPTGATAQPVDQSKTATPSIACALAVLKALLPEAQAITVLANAENTTPVSDAANALQAEMKLHHDLMACSPVYVSLMNELLRQLNVLPASAAMAGVYTMTDNSYGVWKAPANVALNCVTAPVANITEDLQANFNLDPVSGTSINSIRQFTGIGPMVWGARTLNGNSEDWRYINVRRTVLMIEQSIKLATRAYVFEPNTAATWTTVQSMITNFLTKLWEQGGLVGATAEEAFSVQVGLGTTMTPDDLLDGKMIVTVQVAIVHPAEFLLLTFQQQMQQS